MFGCCSRATASASARKRAGRLGAGVRAGQDHLQGARARLSRTCAGLVDDAHAAAAQLAEDLVAGDCGAGALGVRVSRSRRPGDRTAEVRPIPSHHVPIAPLGDRFHDPGQCLLESAEKNRLLPRHTRIGLGPARQSPVPAFGQLIQQALASGAALHVLLQRLAHGGVELVGQESCEPIATRASALCYSSLSNLRTSSSIRLVTRHLARYTWATFIWR